MKARLLYIQHRLRQSFWFLPTLMTVFALGASVLTLTMDQSIDTTLTVVLPWAQDLGHESARLILSTIAGSIITVASLVFSLTLVSLTLASGQLGPRLLSLFMADRMTQFVLGTFIATFVFALLVLSSLGDAERALPKTAIVISLMLTLFSFGLLIAFIHHLAGSLRADRVIARVAEELNERITTLLENGAAADESDELVPTWENGQAVAAQRAGYVQAIDVDALVDLAATHGKNITLLYRAGQFVYQGDPVALVHAHASDAGDAVQANHTETDLPSVLTDELPGDICACIVLGPQRTSAEDPEFSLQSIVEIALRALSPGINDPYTAVSCIDWLGEALSRVLSGSMPPAVVRDEHGEPRLLVRQLTHEGLIATAFNEIRQAAEGNVAVLIQLASTLARLAPSARTTGHRTMLRRHVEMLRRVADRSVLEPNDRLDFDSRIGSIDQSLG